MFEVGKLLRFDPFIFPDGGQPKPKYFIVLNNDGAGILLASLPTSKDHVPTDVTFSEGCLEIPERCINVFAFSAGQKVTPDFAFPRATFVYGAALKLYMSADFVRQTEKGDIKITDLGQIDEGLFAALKECLKNSAAVRGKFKKML